LGVPGSVYPRADRDTPSTQSAAVSLVEPTPRLAIGSLDARC
jgi:hypothetical protein